MRSQVCSSALTVTLSDLKLRICRTSEIFSIIIDYPDSTGALQDLKVLFLPSSRKFGG
jgi:hypothetical protein